MNDHPVVFLRGMQETIFVNRNEIICAQAEGNYTNIILTKNRQVKILRKLKQVDELLPNINFIRIHRSYH